MARTFGFACIQVLSLFVVFDYVQTCNPSGIQSCLDNFQHNMGMLNVGDPSYHSDPSPTSRADHICRSYQTFKRCFDSLAQDWTNKGSSSKSIFYINQYICNAGREDYIKYSDCWLDTSVQTATAGCATENTRPCVFDKQEVCAYISSILGCSGDIVYNHCGRDAAIVYSTFNAHFLLVSYQLPSCPNVKRTYASVSNNPYKTGSRTPNGYTPMTSSVAVVMAAVLTSMFKYMDVV